MTDPSADTAAEARLLKRHGLDTVAGAFACAAGAELTKPGLGRRQRLRLDLTDDAGRPVRWYLKRYGAEPWLVRLGRLIFGAGRVSQARREFQNIRRLRSAGVPTMHPIAFGEETGLLAPRRSYVLTAAVGGEALDRCFQQSASRWTAAEMERFNDALIELVRRLHATGCVHRDLYASHVFLEPSPDAPRLYLIDLARLFAPRWRLFRWRVKDLAQLKYSMPQAWTRQYWDAFLDGYLAGTGGSRRRWAAAIDRKLAAMQRRRRWKQPGEDR